MKLQILTAIMLMATALFSCKKDNKQEPDPALNTAPKDFISMKVDNVLYVDSIGTASDFQKINQNYAELNVSGKDAANSNARLVIKIGLREHEIKPVKYGQVTENANNAIDWVVNGQNFQAHSNNDKYPDAPFEMVITKSNDLVVEGYFSGRAFSSNNGTTAIKEVKEGKFRISKKNIKIINHIK